MTGFPALAAFTALLVASEVLPEDVAAAITLKSLVWNPPRLSMYENPVGMKESDTPVILSLTRCIIFALASFREITPVSVSPSFSMTLSISFMASL